MQRLGGGGEKALETLASDQLGVRKERLWVCIVIYLVVVLA